MRRKERQSSSNDDAAESSKVMLASDSTSNDDEITGEATSPDASSTADLDSPELHNRVLRKAETVIQGRTSRVIVVVERCVDDHNYSAIIRTAEALGVQHVWLIDPVVGAAVGPPSSDPLPGTHDDAGGGEGASVSPSKVGVVWHRLEQKWRAMLTVGPQTTNLGFFATEDAAARAYDAAAAPYGLPLNFATEDGDADGSPAATAGPQALGYAAPHRYEHNMFAKQATEWVTLREFATTAECVAALRQDGRTVWATDLSQHAVCLTRAALEAADAAGHGATHPASSRDGAARDVVPQRLAIVFGTESVGCTAEILAAADRRVYLPLRGFADSLNLSVAAALVLQQLFHLCPAAVASMPDDERHALRASWFPKVSVSRIY
jgi:tRNA G18 (ribose-2'-O)-methylase SpoU